MGSCCTQPGFLHAGLVTLVGLVHADMVIQRYVCFMKVMNCDNFYRVMRECMYINTNHVVYNGWKAGMLYSGVVYGRHYGTKK